MNSTDSPYSEGVITPIDVDRAIYKIHEYPNATCREYKTDWLIQACEHHYALSSCDVSDLAHYYHWQLTRLQSFGIELVPQSITSNDVSDRLFCLIQNVEGQSLSNNLQYFNSKDGIAMICSLVEYLSESLQQDIPFLLDAFRADKYIIKNTDSIIAYAISPQFASSNEERFTIKSMYCLRAISRMLEYCLDEYTTNHVRKQLQEILENGLFTDFFAST